MSRQQARRALDKAINNGGNLDIVFPSKKDAQNFRYSLYKVRTDQRKKMADVEGVPEELVDTDYDDLSFTIKRRDENNYVIQIRIASDEIVFLDPNTGEAL